MGEVATEISVTTPEPEDAIADLNAGRTDLAIVHEYSNVPRTRVPGVGSDDIVREHVWLALKEQDPSASAEVDQVGVSDHRWITATRGLTCFEMTDRACGLAGCRRHVVARSMDFATQLESVAAGSRRRTRSSSHHRCQNRGGPDRSHPDSAAAPYHRNAPGLDGR